MTECGQVLVVDDDESIRETLDIALSGEGYTVQAAANGAEALELLQRWRPDVILLDMKMPGTDGWAFAESYRSLPHPRPPIVVVTAARDAAEWAAEISADEVLAKPFDLTSLLDMVARYTAQREAR